MLRTMFKPFFKRFIGLFISMVFVSMLSIGLLCCFGSVIINLKRTYANFLNEYQLVDEQVSTGFVDRENLLSYVKEVEGVKEADARLTLDCYLRKPDQRTIVSRIFSYNETTNILFKRHIRNNIEPSKEYYNISLAAKFADNNKFKVGDVVELGFFGLYAKFYIMEIIETPEGIYPRANDYVWSDQTDFGYIYISEPELDKGLLDIAQKVREELEKDPEFKQYYEEFIAKTGITIPDFREFEGDFSFTNKYANQVLVENAESYKDKDLSNEIKSKFESEGVKVKTAVSGKYLPYRLYMDHAIEQLNVASIFLPVFFYSVTMVVIGLFMSQIIKIMTPQIGILISIGVGKKDIVTLFIIYAGLMGLTSGILGGPLGYLLSTFMTRVMRMTYSMSLIPATLSPLMVAIAVLLLMLFAAFATFISCLAIFKITPKDAVISNESKRKPIPKWLSKVIDKAPMNIKLGTNSIAQNPKRFFVSSFSIFSSLVLILLSTLFSISKDEMIAQSVERRLSYDAQIYLTQREDESFINQIKGQDFIDGFLDCAYTYAKVTKSDGSDTYIECLGVNMTDYEGHKAMLNIPNNKGIGSLTIPKEGIILPKGHAQNLGVKKGDSLTINGKPIVVQEISYQYFHPIAYLSADEMDRLDIDYVSSFILDIAKGHTEQDLLDYLSNERNQCLTVFTSSLSKDLHRIFDAINIFIYIMVGFSLGMSFVILFIMSQNALMEQQRPLTVLRAIGFRILDISHVWTLQSASQLFVSALFGLPVGGLVTYILLSMCSSNSQIYPFIFHWLIALMAVGFVLLVIIACHLLSMRTISKWNIANNTRCRE